MNVPARITPTARPGRALTRLSGLVSAKKARTMPAYSAR
jgi:hypothetical protein